MTAKSNFKLNKSPLAIGSFKKWLAIKQELVMMTICASAIDIVGRYKNLQQTIFVEIKK